MIQQYLKFGLLKSIKNICQNLMTICQINAHIKIYLLLFYFQQVLIIHSPELIMLYQVKLKIGIESKMLWHILLI